MLETHDVRERGTRPSGASAILPGSMPRTGVRRGQLEWAEAIALDAKLGTRSDGTGAPQGQKNIRSRLMACVATALSGSALDSATGQHLSLIHI